jgi:hypothetical protein
MESIRRGFRLLGKSWQVLREDKELLWLPVFSFAGMFVVFALVGVVGVVLGAFEPGASRILRFSVLFVSYFGVYSVAIFFNAAVVGAATIRLDDRDPTIADGLRIARSKLGKILQWALLSASVGVVLHVLQEKAGWLGRLVLGFAGAAWGVVTFFVVPVLLFEQTDVAGSVKRSASLFKKSWGEGFVGNGGIGIALFLLALPLFAFCALLLTLWPLFGGVLMVLALGAVFALGGVLSGIFNAALYRYAANGESGELFEASDLRSAFRRKKDPRAAR